MCFIIKLLTYQKYITIDKDCWELYDLYICTNWNYNVWIKHDVLCSQIIFVNQCDHLSLLRLKLILVKWSNHWQQFLFQISTWMHTRIFTCQDSTTPFDEIVSCVTLEHAIGFRKKIFLKVWVGSQFTCIHIMYAVGVIFEPDCPMISRNAQVRKTFLTYLRK